MRDKYFESEKDEVKLEIYYEKKYKEIFFEVVLHVIFLFMIILSLFYHSFPTWHHYLHSEVYNDLKNVNINSTSGNKSVFKISIYFFI